VQVRLQKLARTLGSGGAIPCVQVSLQEAELALQVLTPAP
jgi:hypothetical protein